MYTYAFSLHRYRWELAAAALFIACKIAAAAWWDSAAWQAQALFNGLGLAAVLAVIPGAVTREGRSRQGYLLRAVAVLSMSLLLSILGACLPATAASAAGPTAPGGNFHLPLLMLAALALGENAFHCRLAGLSRRSRCLATAALAGHFRKSVYLYAPVFAALVLRCCGYGYAERLIAALLMLYLCLHLFEMLRDLLGLTVEENLPGIMLHELKRAALKVEGVLAVRKIEGKMAGEGLVLRLHLLAREGLNGEERESLRETVRQALLHRCDGLARAHCAASSLAEQRERLLRSRAGPGEELRLPPGLA